MPARMACSRKSGVVSMRTWRPPYSTSTDGRSRRSSGSADVQTRQVQPIVGTPIDVPLPSTVRVAFIVGQGLKPRISRYLVGTPEGRALLHRAGQRPAT